MALLARRAAPAVPASLPDAELPTVSLIIAAYNEADIIVRKLDNIFALDYPRDRLEVLVASDGSNDRTNALGEQYDASEVRLLDLPRQGKNLTLNAAVPVARH